MSTVSPNPTPADDLQKKMQDMMAATMETQNSIFKDSQAALAARRAEIFSKGNDTVLSPADQKILNTLIGICVKSPQILNAMVATATKLASIYDANIKSMADPAVAMNVFNFLNPQK